MDMSQHTLSTLFEQLGLPSDTQSVDDFIARHAPLPPETALAEPVFCIRVSTTTPTGRRSLMNWMRV